MDQTATTSRAKVSPKKVVFRRSISSKSSSYRSRIEHSRRLKKRPRPVVSKKIQAKFQTVPGRCKAGHRAAKIFPNVLKKKTRNSKTGNTKKSKKNSSPNSDVDVTVDSLSLLMNCSNQSDVTGGTPTTDSVPASCDTSSTRLNETESKINDPPLRPPYEPPAVQLSSTSQLDAKSPSELSFPATIQTKTEDESLNTTILSTVTTSNVSTEEPVNNIENDCRDLAVRSPNQSMAPRNQNRNSNATKKVIALNSKIRKDRNAGLYLSDPCRRTISDNHFTKIEYMEDVGILSELVKKATVDFFKDTGTPQFTFGISPFLDTQMQTCMRGIDTNSHSNGNSSEVTPSSSTHPLCHSRPPQVGKKTPRTLHTQLSSSASEILRPVGSKNIHSTCKISSDNKPERHFSGGKKRGAQRDKSHRDSQDKIGLRLRRLPSSGNQVKKNARICTSIELERDQHTVQIRNKQNKINSALAEGLYRDTTTSNEDVSGLQDAMADNKIRLDKELGKKKRRCGTPLVARRICSEKLPRSPSFSSQTLLNINSGCKGDAFGLALPMRSSLPKRRIARKPESFYTKVGNENIPLYSKSTQTYRDCSSKLGCSHEPRLKFSLTTCNRDSSRAWATMPTQTNKPSILPSKIKETKSSFSRSNNIQNLHIPEDLPTYLTPSDAWAFYNSTKIRLPFMEIDGIFDGTPFGSISGNPIITTPANRKAIQVNFRQNTATNVNQSLSPSFSDTRNCEVVYEPTNKKPVLEPGQAQPTCTRTRRSKYELEKNDEHKFDPETTETKSLEESTKQNIPNVGISLDTLTMSTSCSAKRNQYPPRPRSKRQSNRKLSKNRAPRYKSSGSVTDTEDQELAHVAAVKKKSKRRSLSRSSFGSQGLPGYARPTTTSDQRVKETKMKFEEQKLWRVMPSRYMSLAPRKKDIPLSKRKKVLCSPCQSSILAKNSSSRLWSSCQQCQMRTGGSKNRANSPSRDQMNCENSRKCISFSFCSQDDCKETSIAEEQMSELKRKSSPEELKSSRVLGASLNCSSSKQNEPDKISFCTKWLKSANEILNPWKKLLSRPQMVSVSCSNTNLIKLPNILQSRRA